MRPRLPGADSGAPRHTATVEAGRPFRVAEATSPALRTAAYRLRYDLLYGERGDDRHVDHDAREYRDSADRAGGRTFVALDADDGVIGTVRGLLRRDAPFPGDEVYPFDLLLGRFPSLLQSKGEIGLLDRGCVAPGWRRRGPFRRLALTTVQALFAGGARLVIGTMDAHHEAPQAAVRGCGFEPAFSWWARGTGPWSLYAIDREGADAAVRSLGRSPHERP